MEQPIMASMLHTLNPFLLKLSFIHEDFGIRWYGMAYLAAFVVGFFIVRFLASRGRSTIGVEQVGDMITYVAIGTMIGGRLGYCLFYKPELFIGFRASFPFWDVLAVHEGGMASHGGMAGIVVACWLFGRRFKQPALHVIDLCALAGPIGVFCGRIANFINGELIGREAPPGLPWAVKFPQDMYSWPMDYMDHMRPHLEQLKGLTPAVEAIGTPAAQWTTWLQNFRYDAVSMSGLRNTIHSLVLAIQNGNEQVARVVEPLLVARHPSQLYEALMEGLLCFIVGFVVWCRPRKPGVVAGCFGVTYAIVRIIGEQFRMPDADIGYQALGLTRGQWLSFGMLAVAVALLIFWSRRPVAAIGGWGTRPDLAPSSRPRAKKAKS